MISTAETGASDSSSTSHPGRGISSCTSEVAKMIAKPMTAYPGGTECEVPSTTATPSAANAINARALAAVRRALIRP